MPENEPQPIKLPQQETRRKRVYQAVSVIEDNGSYSIQLDGRALHTPGRKGLVTPQHALALAIAKEWDDQIEYIDPASMPLTKLLNTCIDRIATNQKQIVDGLMQYVDTDLLCYRAESPLPLVRRQAEVWQPVLDWLSAVHDISLPVVAGVTPISLTSDVEHQMRMLMLSFSPEKLTGVQGVASLTSSLCLAIAMIDSHLSGAEVAAAATLDETWQIEQWGEDKEARQRLIDLAKEIASIERFITFYEKAA